MPQPALPPESTHRLADRLAAVRRGRFVGRQAEFEIFRSALLAPEPPFAVLHVHGPGGVGKTSLLHKYTRIAAECGRQVVYLDGRNVEPSPAGFLRALRLAMGFPADDVSPATPEWPGTGVLLLDTYESLAPLDAWLRESFLPGLPDRSLVVLAGRTAPAAAWRTDLDWAGLTRILVLRNLRPEESETYLATRGIPDAQHAAVLAFTHGHPLALALVADVLGHGDRLASFDPRDEPDVVRLLLERLVQDVPSARHRRALESCVLAWVTTEALLADVLETDDVHDLFTWLRQQTYIQHGPHGIFPHDLAREALDADLRWRDPHGHEDLYRRVGLHLRSQWARTSGFEQQRLRLEIFFANRHHPGMEHFLAWDALDSGYAELATRSDAPAIIAMVRAHEGERSARIAAHWLGRQPQAFSVFRGSGADPHGFMANLSLHAATPEDIAADPAIAAALRFAERHGPVHPGEEWVHLRFWMGRETYHAVSPATNLTATNSVNYWLTHPNLAWSFVTMSNPQFWEPHFASRNFQRSPEADFDVDDRHYGVFSRDWRVAPATAWGLVPSPDLPNGHSRTGASLAPAVTLSEDEFAAAVRQALRDFTRPDRLATSPLLRIRLVAGTEEGGPPATLQRLLREAVGVLASNPKDVKLHRALWHTYIEPAETQELAAELLGLPFNTYRYHLARGIERVTAWLWLHEHRQPDR